jgi:type VI secretion system protein ImpA
MQLVASAKQLDYNVTMRPNAPASRIRPGASAPRVRRAAEFNRFTAFSLSPTPFRVSDTGGSKTVSTIDIETLLAEVSAEDPCGPDLEYDADMRELEQAAQGKPEQQMGDTIVAGEEPDWRDVQRRTISLFSRTKDLRVSTLLTKALLRNGGFEGLADGLAVMRGMVDRFWDNLHPRLDPDDANDPTMRINIVTGLCDQDGMLVAVRNTPFVVSPNLGRFGLRELAFASGDGTPTDGQPAPSMSTIDGAFMDASLESISSCSEALSSCLEQLRELEAKLTDVVGSSNAPNLDGLRRLLFQASKLVKEKLTARTAGDSDESGSDQEPGAQASVGSGNGNASPGRSLSGDVRSRDDVVRTLDKIVEYYQRFEPSSPVPILVKRCKRLVTASFEDIVKNLIPDAVTQLEVIKGPADENGN